MLKAIARDVGGKGHAVSSGIKAMFAARVSAARRSGLPADQIAAIIHGIMQEQQAAMKAAADATAQELTGRIAAASREGREKHKQPQGEKGPGSFNHD